MTDDDPMADYNRLVAVGGSALSVLFVAQFGLSGDRQFLVSALIALSFVGLASESFAHRKRGRAAVSLITAGAAMAALALGAYLLLRQDVSSPPALLALECAAATFLLASIVWRLIRTWQGPRSPSQGT
jgi:hypothetical protein